MPWARYIRLLDGTAVPVSNEAHGDEAPRAPNTEHQFEVLDLSIGLIRSETWQALHLLGADALDVDANAGADASRGQIGGRVDRSNVKRQVARELEKSDIERVWREIGSEVATIVHGGGVRRQVDRGEGRGCDEVRLKPDCLIIVDEQQNPLLNICNRRRRARGGGGVEIVNVDLRGIGTRANGGAGCAGILNPTNKLHAVNERHHTLLCGFWTGPIISPVASVGKLRIPARVPGAGIQLPLHGMSKAIRAERYT